MKIKLKKKKKDLLKEDCSSTLQPHIYFSSTNKSGARQEQAKPQKGVTAAASWLAPNCYQNLSAKSVFFSSSFDVIFFSLDLSDVECSSISGLWGWLSNVVKHRESLEKESWRLARKCLCDLLHSFSENAWKIYTFWAKRTESLGQHSPHLPPFGICYAVNFSDCSAFAISAHLALVITTCCIPIILATQYSDSMN